MTCRTIQVLFACGSFLGGLQNAQATPSTPNVSSGSNPYESIYGLEQINYADNVVVFTNSTSHAFMIKNYRSGSMGQCVLKIDGNTVFSHYLNSEL